MAARIRAKHQDEIREKIRASQLVNRLIGHALGEIELSATQVSACKILLDKIVSNAPTEITGADGEPLIPETFTDLEAARRIAFVMELGVRQAAEAVH